MQVSYYEVIPLHELYYYNFPVACHSCQVVLSIDSVTTFMYIHLKFPPMQ